MAKAAKAAAVVETAPVAPLKLDFGCGPNKREGFHGVDQTAFPGVDTVLDVRQAPWPWADNSVEEAHASHFLEHLTAPERCVFFNELYRVLKPGASAQIITPHWNSPRAYGDPTHQWPPVSEWLFLYLAKDWRAANAPHADAAHNPAGYACDFTHTLGWAIRADLTVRNAEFQQFALQNYKDAAQDTVATVVKRA